MPIDLIIRDARVVGPHGPEKMDIGIDGGRIVALSSEPIGSAKTTIDAGGLSRIFHVSSVTAVYVTISELTMTGGVTGD